MFPAIMPWLMTLSPTSEAIRRENCAEKNLDKEKNTPLIWMVVQDARTVLLSKSATFCVCESMRKRNRTHGPEIFAFNL
jgi:hypothetical protein